MKATFIISAIIAITFLLIWNRSKWRTVDKTYCGYVKWKLEEPHKSKYKTWQEPLFVVKFDSIDRPFEVRPTWDDFMSLKQGDRVCYTYPQGIVERKPPADAWISLILAIIAGIVWVVVFIMLILWRMKE